MYARQTALPASEPVALADMKQFLRVDPGFADDDVLITGFIQAAREVAEVYTGRALAQRTFVLVLDSFPYYTDTIQSQLAYPPSYYSLPRYSTTLWNYSQMIKLPFPPVISVQNINYVDTTGNIQTLNQDTDFVLDSTTEQARIFPLPGQYWPADLYVANATQINFTAGYDPNPAATFTRRISGTINPPDQQPTTTIVSGVPQKTRTGILMLVAYWYEQRGLGDVPSGVERLFYSDAVLDFAPTRG